MTEDPCTASRKTACTKLAIKPAPLASYWWAPAAEGTSSSSGTLSRERLSVRHLSQVGGQSISLNHRLSNTWNSVKSEGFSHSLTRLQALDLVIVTLHSLIQCNSTAQQWLVSWYNEQIQAEWSHWLLTWRKINPINRSSMFLCVFTVSVLNCLTDKKLGAVLFE